MLEINKKWKRLKMKRETKFRIYARFLLVVSISFLTVGVVLADIWFLVSGVIYMFVAMWEESDANTLHWDEWYQKNKDLIRKQKERLKQEWHGKTT